MQIYWNGCRWSICSFEFLFSSSRFRCWCWIGNEALHHYTSRSRAGGRGPDKCGCRWSERTYAWLAHIVWYWCWTYLNVEARTCGNMGVWRHIVRCRSASWECSILFDFLLVGQSKACLSMIHMFHRSFMISLPDFSVSPWRQFLHFWLTWT